MNVDLWWKFHLVKSDTIPDHLFSTVKLDKKPEYSNYYNNLQLETYIFVTNKCLSFMNIIKFYLNDLLNTSIVLVFK